MYTKSFLLQQISNEELQRKTDEWRKKKKKRGEWIKKNVATTMTYLPYAFRTWDTFLVDNIDIDSYDVDLSDNSYSLYTNTSNSFEHFF